MHIFDHESAATCCPHGCAPSWSPGRLAIWGQNTACQGLGGVPEFGPRPVLFSAVKSLGQGSLQLHRCQLLSIQEFYRLPCQLEMGPSSSIYMMEIGKCPKSELSTNSQTTPAHSSTLQEALPTFKQAEDWGRRCGRRACMHKALS